LAPISASSPLSRGASTNEASAPASMYRFARVIASSTPYLALVPRASVRATRKKSESPIASRAA
jgi:hypothetical protein